MGLLLSILVFSVGVLEALACVRHIQQGILPAWAPRHVTSSSGRRLLREHWRKSTSLDDGSGGSLGPSGDAGALPNGAPSRLPPGERKGSLDEEQAGRPRPPPLTLSESPHPVRSPDIHWPEPVPHSPAKHIEQTLPSPVAEVPADAPTWPADAAPTPLLQRRRTSTSETLPHEELGQAEPLRAAASAAPPPSFAREAREPPRNKPAKASSFEEARVQAFAPPPPKAPEVASVNHHAPAPRAALVHSIEVTSSAHNSLDDAPAPWPIVNIDTVATSDEEGDVSPTSNLASRRVSFDPVPTVVVIDNEKPITEERERGTILAPSIRITDDLESVLRKELPSVIDDIIQEALVKVNEVLESRQNGPLNGVSLLIENLVSKGGQVLKGPMSSASAEEYKDRFEPTVQSVIELQKDKDVVLSAIPQENKLGRSKEEIGALPNGHPTLLKKEETPSTGLQKSHPRENEAQISIATADQISPSAPAKDGYANTLQFGLAPSEEPNSEIEFGKDVLLDNSKLGDLSASSEPASQTNVQNSIQDAKKRLGNSEELIPESVSGSENKTNDETGGISNCVAEPPVIPNKTKSAPNSTQSLHDITNENEAVENEIRNEMQGDDGSEERVPETTWKLQSPTAGESLILGDAAVAAAAPVPAESGSIASAPASSAALPPSESRENAAPVPLASASESPVASAAPHIPSDAPEFPVAPDSTSESIPLDAVFPDQAIPNNAPESSSPTEDISASSIFPSPNVSIALDSPAASTAPEVHVAPAAPAAPSTLVAPAAPAAAVALASPIVPAAAVATIAPSVPAHPTTPAAVVPPTSPAAPSTPNAPATPAASAVLSAPIPEAPFSSVASAVPADSAVVAPASPVAPASSVAPTSPAAPVAPSPIAPAASAAPAASVAPTSPAAAAAPFAPTSPVAPAASVAPTSPAAAAAPVAPASPVAPAASVAPTSPAAPAAPTSSVAPAVSVAPTSPAAPVALSSPVAPAASVAPTSPAAAAAPIAPFPPSPAVPVPAPGSSKARPASAAPQPPAPAPAVGAPLKEEEPSRAPSSSGRPAGGGRAAAPAAPKAPEALAAPAPQPGAFWLIFSGEYTKAMSKDWHSGHFCCWQCDESLTGQRYVLRDDHPYCIKCYESVFANTCEECNRIIGIDSKDLSYKDKHWHEACFLCTKCRVSLVDKQFGSKADKIYCGNCYDAQFASRCDGCGEIFRAGTKKMEYKTRQWHEKCFCCCVCKTPIGTKSFIPREQEIYCAGCYEEKFATRCVKCNKIITSGGVTYKNEPWHRECFTCTNCNTSLAGQRFTSRDEKPYCAECFGELFAKRCTSCSKPITGIGGTRFISFEDRHWHNDCFICAMCKTSLVGRGFITDADDIICPECAKQKLM